MSDLSFGGGISSIQFSEVEFNQNMKNEELQKPEDKNWFLTRDTQVRQSQRCRKTASDKLTSWTESVALGLTSPISKVLQLEETERCFRCSLFHAGVSVISL